MRVLTNDPMDTMTSTAKKVMNSFRTKQTQWEQNIPFGKKKETKVKKKHSVDTPLAVANTNIRSNMKPKIDGEHVPEAVAKAAKIMPKLDHSELTDLPMASAKPSEIAAAAKAKRKATMEETKAARERQQKVLEQQMKMNRYRDEIANIKKKQEAETKSKRKHHKEGMGTNEIAAQAVEKLLTKDVTDEDEKAVLGYTSDDFISDDDSDYEDEVITMQSPRLTTENIRRQSVMAEMKGTFQVALDASRRDDGEEEKDSSTPVSISAVPLSMEPPRQREYHADKDGRLRQAPRRGSVGGGKRKSGPPERKSSTNLVPEMRRRPNQTDLLFDEKVNPTVLIGVKDEGYHGTQFHKQQKESEKKQKEKQQIEEQKKKLEEAEEAFKRGHNLCWQIRDSPGALQEYRTALFIRESLLGKYHEQTGRTYFWIGKSLVKLDEFSEALVAFSRALRIFERVVRKQHKYYKWTVSAIDDCIAKKDDPDFKAEGYKGRLYASIQFERDGDEFRKQGKMAEAIAKYRDAIEHIEDYHPDAADLYSKIALILRQDGDFERAQEEYRFACEIYEMSLGADHPETIKALNEVMEKKRLGQLSNMLKNKLKLKA